MLVLWREENQRTRRKTLRTGWEPTTNSTYMWCQVRESNPDHGGGRRVLSPLHHPCIPMLYIWADASPSQGYPPALNLPVPIYKPGWKEALWEYSVLPKNTTQYPRPELKTLTTHSRIKHTNPEATMPPPHPTQGKHIITTHIPWLLWCRSSKDINIPVQGGSGLQHS